MYINICQICYCNLIWEESKIKQKETNENAEHLKYQVVREKGRHNKLVEKYNELVDEEKKQNKNWKELKVKKRGNVLNLWGA